MQNDGPQAHTVEGNRHPRNGKGDMEWILHSLPCHIAHPLCLVTHSTSQRSLSLSLPPPPHHFLLLRPSKISISCTLAALALTWISFILLHSLLRTPRLLRPRPCNCCKCCSRGSRRSRRTCCGVGPCASPRRPRASRPQELPGSGAHGESMKIHKTGCRTWRIGVPSCSTHLGTKNNL